MRVSVVLMVCGVLLLSACSSDEHQDLRQWMENSSKDLKGKIPPLPQVKPYKAVEYVADKTGGPFRPGKILPEQKGSGVGGPDQTRLKEPLEHYPLESISFIGLLEKEKNRYAILKVDGALHRIAVGNYLGQDFGVVTRIGETDLSLRELIQDAGGDWVERTSSLQLLDQKESKK